MSIVIYSEYLDVSLSPVHADERPVLDHPGRAIDAHDRGDAVLPRDDSAVGHEAADLRHEPGRDREERGPGRVGIRRDQDVTLLDPGLLELADDPRTALDDPGGCGGAGESPGGNARPRRRLDHFPLARDEARRAKRPVPRKPVPPLVEELAIDLSRLKRLLDLGER